MNYTIDDRAAVEKILSDTFVQGIRYSIKVEIENLWPNF